MGSKDLIVDMDLFFESFRSVNPFLMTSAPAKDGKERKQAPWARADTRPSASCAQRARRAAVFWTDGQYFGPAAIVNAHRFIFDSRDEGAQVRLDILNDK